MDRQVNGHDEGREKKREKESVSIIIQEPQKIEKRLTKTWLC